jgi:hypothetical protein
MSDFWRRVIADALRFLARIFWPNAGPNPGGKKKTREKPTSGRNLP